MRRVREVGLVLLCSIVPMSRAGAMRMGLSCIQLTSDISYMHTHSTVHAGRRCIYTLQGRYYFV
jgi:hypothetical protein